jgi:protein-S-isoprenylcysteine O-methyltransferase Ste14
VLALLIIPGPADRTDAARLIGAGAVLVVFGELIRLWGVHHIGAISRTRSDRLGPLIDDGPFALIRNPLYFGNVLLWVGFTISSELLWLVPIVAVMLGLEYHAIVRWEERLLESRMGQVYCDYMRRVPRWMPRLGRVRPEAPVPESRARTASFSWSETLFSERGTLLAITAGYVLLALKSRTL